MYKAMNIAQYIITKCTQDGSPISNLQDVYKRQLLITVP